MHLIYTSIIYFQDFEIKILKSIFCIEVSYGYEGIKMLIFIKKYYKKWNKKHLIITILKGKKNHNKGIFRINYFV